ncbi:MAG: translation initiation factor IF-3 [Chloroflexi bacterium]|nr:translation initiation factor IF-3 [Chloroflexota bacterium]
MERELRINEAIRAPQVRVIGEEGGQLGIMPIAQALSLARSRNLDLIEVAPQAVPPVCRILDYGKFIYERHKREKEARKAQKAIEVREMRFRPKTGAFHQEIKAKRVRKFLEQGAKVRLRVLFRGRENTHPEVGFSLLQDLAKMLEDVGAVDTQPQMEGRSVFMILAPLKRKTANKQAKVEERADAKDQNP